MFGFGSRGCGKGRWGGPGWGRAGRWAPWGARPPFEQSAEGHWGRPGYRWQWEAQQFPPAERKAYLEAFKSHLEARLEEVNQALQALEAEED